MCVKWKGLGVNGWNLLMGCLGLTSSGLGMTRQWGFPDWQLGVACQRVSSYRRWYRFVEPFSQIQLNRSKGGHTGMALCHSMSHSDWAGNFLSLCLLGEV